MSRPAFGLVLAAALAAALGLRLADPAGRPMHHDEANQAWRAGVLLETGEYRYDPHDHHGPTLYYLTLPVAWARGQWTAAALDERTIRLVPAIFGIGLVLLALPFARGIGYGAAAWGAVLMALSPALTYYSRVYIQEPLFVFFALAFVVSAGRYVERPRTLTASAAGLLAGLTFSTKETALIVLPIAVAACLGAAWLARPTPRGRAGAAERGRHLLAVLGSAAVPVVVLYSAFFRHPGGVRDAFTAIPIYLSRGVNPEAHVQAWSYYLETLAWSSSGGLVWSEALVLALAAVGIAHAVTTRSFWPLYLTSYALGTLAVFSAVRYKTPWNLLPFYAPLVLVAGIGASALVVRVRPAGTRAVLVLVLAIGAAQLGLQSIRASFRYAADDRNPYVYVHTVRDYLRLAARVRDLAAVHPDGRHLFVKVITSAEEQWPFPWYARHLSRVGYWADPGAAGPLEEAAVILTSRDHADAVDTALGGRYVSEYYGLRDGVLLTLFIEPDLWDRFLAAARDGSV